MKLLQTKLPALAGLATAAVSGLSSTVSADQQLVITGELDRYRYNSDDVGDLNPPRSWSLTVTFDDATEFNLIGSYSFDDVYNIVGSHTQLFMEDPLSNDPEDYTLTASIPIRLGVVDGFNDIIDVDDSVSFSTGFAAYNQDNTGMIYGTYSIGFFSDDLALVDLSNSPSVNVENLVQAFNSGAIDSEVAFSLARTITHPHVFFTGDVQTMQLVELDGPCVADINGDGIVDLTDVTAFVDSYQMGCP